MSVEHSLLGKDTQYPTQYQPRVLFPIARAESRENYADVEGITQGKDWWHVFEISWLNALVFHKLRLVVYATRHFKID
jgi:7-cyano-7-deazaguanine reductase